MKQEQDIKDRLGIYAEMLLRTGCGSNQELVLLSAIDELEWVLDEPKGSTRGIE